MAELLEYKCPCCGGAIAFSAADQKMKCPYCDTEFEMESLKAYDEALKQDRPDDLTWENRPGGQWSDGEEAGMRVYACNSCGGEIVGDANTAAASCPFCGNPVVMTGQLSGQLKPDYVIPFKLDKNAAKAGLMRHLQGKRLVPKVFQDQNHIDEIKGIYVPFWLFNADADADIRYRATRVHAWSDRNYDYIDTSYFMVNRSGSLSFERVPVDGASKIPDDLMESIEPYDYTGAVDFQTAYLAGYFADKYDVDSAASAERANERIKRSTETAFQDTVQGFNTVTPEYSAISLRSGQTYYALLPVWLLNTTWNGQTYIFAMNGQTGKFVGDLPVDKRAARRWFWLSSLIGAAVIYGAAWLVHLLGGLL